MIPPDLARIACRLVAPPLVPASSSVGVDRNAIDSIPTLARGTFVERVIAARLGEIVGPGLTDDVLPHLRRLADHPEPAIWMPAVRGIASLLTRLSALAEEMRERARSRVPRVHRRALMTLLCADPETVPDSEVLPLLRRHLPRTWVEPWVAPGGAKEQVDSWTVAILGPALPVAAARRPWFADLVEELIAADLSSARVPVLRSAAEGLAACVRVGAFANARLLLESLRRRWEPTVAGLESVDRYYQSLLLQWATDAAVGLDVDVDDLEGVAYALIAAVARAPDAALDRSAALARRIPSFVEHHFRLCRGNASPAVRARSRAAIESAAMAVALAPWELVARATDQDIVEAGDHSARARGALMRAARAGILDAEASAMLHRTVLRAAGLLVDATPEPTRGERFAEVLVPVQRAAFMQKDRKLGERGKAVTDVVWRLLDGSLAPGAPDVATELPLIAAWWMVASRLATERGRLEWLLERGDASFAKRLDADARAKVERIRTALGEPDASRSAAAVRGAFADLGMTGRRLAVAVTAVCDACVRLDTARADTAPGAWAALGTSTGYVRSVLRDPARALELAPPDEVGSLGIAATGAPNDPTGDAAAVLRNPLTLPWAFDPRTDLASATAREVAEGTANPDDLEAAWTRDLGDALSRRVGQSTREAVRRLRTPRTYPSRPVIDGKYELVRRLGEGGMGVVWLAHRRRSELPPRTSGAPISDNPVFLERDPTACTLKLPPGFSGDRLNAPSPRFKQSFANEVAAVAALRHPNIVQYLDHGVDLSTKAHFVVTEYLHGATLGRYANARRLDIDEVKPIVADVIRALSALHRLSIFHRDVKPDNVMLCMDLEGGEFDVVRHRDPEHTPIQRAVLLDLGISLEPTPDDKIQPMGTVGFMAPEQIDPRLGPIGPKSDVYGLAATLYRVITGTGLFEGVPAALVAPMTVTDGAFPQGPPHTDRVSRELGKLLYDSTRKKPDERESLEGFGRRLAEM